MRPFLLRQGMEPSIDLLLSVNRGFPGGLLSASKVT